jgi:hypothetical protein
MAFLKTERQFRFANKTFFEPWFAVHKNPVIDYFLEQDKSLDKVLNISFALTTEQQF